MNPRPNIPEFVYEYALKRNLEALRQLQEDGHCLTQFHYAFHDDFNAIAKLAFDGHGDAAEFLVDHLIGSINDLVTGYAHAGNVERTLHWVSRGGKPTFAVTGFGYAGNVAAIDNFINDFGDKFPNTINNSKNFHYVAVIGLAKGLHHALLNQYLDQHFPEDPLTNSISHTRIIAIWYAIRGYAISHDEQGLTLATANNIDVDHNYYAYLSVHAPMESIPQEKIRYFLPIAARFGFDEPISNHLDNLDQEDRNLIALFYHEGGHLPPQEMPEIKVTHIITSLYNYDHHSMIEAFLENPASEREHAEKHHYGYDKYHEKSPNGKASTLVSRSEEIQTRQLLQIKDEAKREHLLWLATGHTPTRAPEKTPKSLKLKRINHIFRQTPLGLDCAMALGSNQDRLVEALNLIQFSLYRCAYPLTNHHTLPLILAHLLNTTEANATKIHKHYAGIFAKCLDPDRIPGTIAPPQFALKG